MEANAAKVGRGELAYATLKMGTSGVGSTRIEAYRATANAHSLSVAA